MGDGGAIVLQSLVAMEPRGVNHESQRFAEGWERFVGKLLSRHLAGQLDESFRSHDLTLLLTAVPCLAVVTSQVHGKCPLAFGSGSRLSATGPAGMRALSGRDVHLAAVFTDCLAPDQVHFKALPNELDFHYFSLLKIRANRSQLF
jgi:hypothetical protein